MNDSSKGPGVLEIIGDIAKDVGKATGETLAQGMKTSLGAGNPKSQTSQGQSGQKTPSELKQIEFTRSRLKTLTQNQAQVRQQNTQKETQRLKQQAQEKQETEQIKQFKLQRVNPPLREDVARTRSELKAGRGVGG